MAQKGHKFSVPKQTELCHIPLSQLRNVRSSRKSLDGSYTKGRMKTSIGQATSEELLARSWLKRDTNEMISRIQNGVLASGINIETHICDQLKKYDVKSGLFGQLHCNFNYRLKLALQDHSYTKDCLNDEHVLKSRFFV